jgi:hypothetical protein
MFKNPQRTTALTTALLLTTAILTSASAPAWADGNDKNDASTCWIQANTGVTQCFTDEETMDAAIVEQIGALPIEQGSLQARSSFASVALVQYTIARLYENASYGGDFLVATATSSTFCADGGVVSVGTMPSGWNDRVSSVRSYWGCQTTLYTNSSAGSLGTMNDKTSSYKVKD